MTINARVQWLLKGDVAIQFQTYRDLLDMNKPELQCKIEKEGWGAQFLSLRNPDGHWAKGFYQPKWTCTHYTLLDLKNLNINPDNKLIRESILGIIENNMASDGGINPHTQLKMSDVCINGMFLNYASYFKTDEELLKSVVDFILSQKMEDGGFNCWLNRQGATHSSLHSTLSVIEGINEYKQGGYTHRIPELLEAEIDSREFILLHKLFLSDKTGRVINKNFLNFYYPCRWYFDILRALDYFQSAGAKYDTRMDEAINIIFEKRTREGFWKQVAKHPGQTHFEMEQAGMPGRWSTLRALRILKHFGIEE